MFSHFALQVAKMAKNIDIPIDEWVAQFKEFAQKIRLWFENFFRTITTYEATESTRFSQYSEDNFVIVR